MRIITWLLAVFGISVWLLLPPRTSQAAPANDVGAILDHVDDLYRGSSSHSTLTMHVVTAHSTRDLDIEQWTKGTDKFLMRILGPEKERGISTLMSGSNIWNYFPKVDQLTKLSPSMMGASWMGSHISNNELVKRSRMRNDFIPTKTFEGTRDGQAVIELTLLPKPDAAVVWGKIVLLIKVSDHNPTKAFYFDEGKKLAQTVIFSAERPFSGRSLPSSMKFVPADKPNEYTEIRWNVLEFDVNVADDKFSQRSLQK
ncbi:outer membrane lipoprotein-sorting protein [Pendulispora albinea]|uniref:Outer membrane lipoprotein-sorting protein n=1 Tax=Pendulispora albinea TaxID=2741071 RepID=A0ABZ2MB34_9BACT